MIRTTKEILERIENRYQKGYERKGEMTETLSQGIMQKFSNALTIFDNNPSLKRLNESFTRNECEMIFRAVVLQFLMLEKEHSEFLEEEMKRKIKSGGV